MAASKNIRILCGTSVRQEEAVLSAYLRSLKALKLPPRTEIDFAFVDDGGHGALLADYRTLPSQPSANDYAVGVDTHHWSDSAIDRVARNKQDLLGVCHDEGYDYFFSVDSDLLLEPTTLINLLHCQAPIVSAVFWTAWQAGGEPLPQVWLRHPYEFSGLGAQPHEFFGSLLQKKFMRVAGGGACTLIHRRVMEMGSGYYPRVEGLPKESMWQGEDRSFAIRNERLHIRQYACAFSDVFHAYHPHQRTPAALDEAWERLSAPRQLCAKYGDWVHFVVEPLEEPQFASRADPSSRTHRGRVGGIKVLPELEAALLDMAVGEERLLDLRFPPWFEVNHYANKHKTVLLKLVDVKPA